jgi:hypothetical protein
MGWWSPCSDENARGLRQVQYIAPARHGKSIGASRNVPSPVLILWLVEWGTSESPFEFPGNAAAKLPLPLQPRHGVPVRIEPHQDAQVPGYHGRADYTVLDLLRAHGAHPQQPPPTRRLGNSTSAPFNAWNEIIIIVTTSPDSLVGELNANRESQKSFTILRCLRSRKLKCRSVSIHALFRDVRLCLPSKSRLPLTFLARAKSVVS